MSCLWLFVALIITVCCTNYFPFLCNFVNIIRIPHVGRAVMPSKASVHLTIKDCEAEGERGQMTQMTKEEMAAHLAAVPASQEERFVCVDT